MMNNICSRCNHPIKDFAPPQMAPVGQFEHDGRHQVIVQVMTAGYYVASGWRKFTNEGEVLVCDDCMWADPRYIAVYGARNG